MICRECRQVHHLNLGSFLPEVKGGHRPDHDSTTLEHDREERREKLEQEREERGERWKKEMVCNGMKEDERGGRAKFGRVKSRH